nr:ABC transporter permease [Paenibacillus xylanexedens]
MTTYIKNFLKYKDLIIEIIKRDIQLKYKNSLLGILWSFLNPLLFMIVLTVIFQELFSSNIEHFALYVLTGRLMYSCFSETTNYAMQSIVSNAALIKKIYVPKYFFPLSKAGSSFINTLLAMLSIIPVMIVSGVQFTTINLLFVFPLLYMLLFSVGIGLILTTIYVFFRDLQHLYSLALVIIMYTSAIFYPATIIPHQILPIIQFNPVFTTTEMFRDILIYNTIPSINDHIFNLLYSLFFVAFGLFLFYKKQDKFIFYL